jgi:hypothetical protein
MTYPDGNTNKPIASDTTQKDLVPFWRPSFFAMDIMSDTLTETKNKIYMAKS